MKTGIELITEERVKQISKYGYTACHDAGYDKELLFGAVSYLYTALNWKESAKEAWPFDEKYYKDEGYIESLKKAGAFIAAELDRINLT